MPMCKTVGAQGDPVRLKFVLLLDSLSSPITKPATVYSSSRRASTFGYASLLVPIILSHGGFQAVGLPHHATAAARPFISSTPTTFLSWQLLEKASLCDAPPMLTEEAMRHENWTP